MASIVKKPSLLVLQQAVKPGATPAPLAAAVDSNQASVWLEMRRAAGWPPLEIHGSK